MPTPTPRLSDYRDKFSVGTVLGLGYQYYHTAYLAHRGTHPTQYTITRLTETDVTFALTGGHRCDLPWDTILTYLRFGRAPYYKENILPVPVATEYGDSTGPGQALRSDVATAVYRVLDRHTPASNEHFASENIWAREVFEGALDAIRAHRASPPTA